MSSSSFIKNPALRVDLKKIYFKKALDGIIPSFAGKRLLSRNDKISCGI